MMNKEVAKAINKKENKFNTIKKWWNKNGYKVMRIILFPAWLGIIIKNKINSYLNSRQKWDKEKVKEILNYYIPRNSEWWEEEKCFYFFDNGYGWHINLAKRYLKRRDRRFWDVNNGFAGGKIRDYLLDEFELEGFKKEVLNRFDNRTEIAFRVIEK